MELNNSRSFNLHSLLVIVKQPENQFRKSSPSRHESNRLNSGLIRKTVRIF